MTLSPHIIVITGASAGVGRAVTRRFAKEGCCLGLIAREPDRLNEAADEARRLGAKAVLAIALDVADADAVDAAAARMERELGPIDLWINNAMVTVLSKIADITPKEHERVHQVTYMGKVNGTLAALAHMRQRGRGHILQVGSALAYRAIPLQAPYCAAKAAVLAFTDSVRAELIADEVNIELSVVQLPAVNTPQFSWARNKTGQRAQPVPPIFSPEVAADAIHHVAHHPTREYWLGRSTYQVAVAQKFAPSIADRFAASAGGSQLLDEPLPERPDNLFAPVKGEAIAAEGRFTDRAQSVSPVNVAQKNWKGAVAVAATAAMVVVAGMRLRGRA